MKIQGIFKEYEVKAIVTHYCNNGNFAVQLLNYDSVYDCWEPYASLTVNFHKKLPENMAYVDTNNVPNAEAFIAEYGLGEHQGKFMFSGFCCYPLYKFYPEKLEKR